MNSDTSKYGASESVDAAIPSRKRMPLDPISPSTQKDSKRRGHQGETVYLETISRNSGYVVNNSENLNPNIQYSTTFSDCSNQKSTPLSTLNQSGNVHRKILGSSNHNETSRSGLSQVNYKIPAQRVQTPLTNNLTGQNGTCGNQVFLSPSQRRLYNVDLSGVSYESPTSRCIRRSKKLNSTPIHYQLPVSRIIDNIPPHTKNMDPRLLATYNQDRGMGYIQNSNFSRSLTQIHPRVTETVEAARQKEIKNHLEVIVPELADLGVR